VSRLNVITGARHRRGPLSGTVAATLALALVAGLGVAQVQAQETGAETAVPPGGAGSTALIVYEGGNAVVRETRSVTLPAGETDLAFPEVPGSADASSLRLRAVGEGGADVTVLTRSLAADLPTQRRLLELSVGKPVTVLIRDQGEGAPPRAVPATVLSVAEDIVLRMEDGIHVGLPGDVVFESLPKGLRTSPTLLATVNAGSEGPRTLALSYLTGGLSWFTDYTLDVSRDMDRGDLTAWATVSNTSGRSFEGARLTLSTGTVSIVSRQPTPMAEPMVMMESVGRGMVDADLAKMASMPAPQGQGGLYFYPIERPVSIAHRQTRQVALVQAPGIDVEPRLVIPDLGTGPYRHESFAIDDPIEAERSLRIRNEEANGLGQALPAGIVRVWQPGPHDVPRFLGSDHIDHLAVGASATVDLGKDFDVRARYKRLSFEETRLWKDQRETKTSHEMTLTNAREDEAVTVEVEARLPGTWDIMEESHPHEALSDSRVRWVIEIPAGGEVVLTHAAKAKF
jgi:hypothetical protein